MLAQVRSTKWPACFCLQAVGRRRGRPSCQPALAASHQPSACTPPASVQQQHPALLPPRLPRCGASHTSSPRSSRRTRCSRRRRPPPLLQARLRHPLPPSRPPPCSGACSRTSCVLKQLATQAELPRTAQGCPGQQVAMQLWLSDGHLPELLMRTHSFPSSALAAGTASRRLWLRLCSLQAPPQRTLLRLRLRRAPWAVQAVSCACLTSHLLAPPEKFVHAQCAQPFAVALTSSLCDIIAIHDLVLHLAIA